MRILIDPPFVSVSSNSFNYSVLFPKFNKNFNKIKLICRLFLPLSSYPSSEKTKYILTKCLPRGVNKKHSKLFYS